MLGLEDNIQKIKGIGAKKAELFAKLDVDTVRSLVYMLPMRYEIYQFCNSLADIKAEGCVAFYMQYNGGAAEHISIGGSRYIQYLYREPAGSVRFVWFNQPYILKTLQKGAIYKVVTRVEYSSGVWSAVNPKLIKAAKREKDEGSFMEPVYSSVAGLKSQEISRYIKLALSELGEIQDLLPKAIAQKYHLDDINTALHKAHMPSGREDCVSARRRLVFDELFLFASRMKLARRMGSASGAGIDIYQKEIERFIASLPYALTNAQNMALHEILRDMENDKPMNRILQGDVGSGKTIVAFLACYAAKLAGKQSIIMAPTELLARQHLESFQKLFHEDDMSAVLLVGSMGSRAKKQAKAEFASGRADVLIGTHAVLESDVEAANLGLVVTDEQHRFGVAQRARLKNKGNPVNMLVMTATPIPRTLSMVLYGDLDISAIDELPPGRLPIKTYNVNSSMHGRIYNFIRREAEAGHQAYLVCPLIENEDEAGESEKLSVKNLHKKLVENELKGLSVGMLYGSMTPEEKEKTAQEFFAGKIQVLVCTTVVEVGVNVPNATIIVIENAERFGLAQLHQLRGRVGRGKEKSYCILITDSTTDTVNARMRIMSQTNNGFEIAERDMELRGSGEYFGLKQSGEAQFRYAQLPEDMELLREASMAADQVLSEPQFAEFREQFTARLSVLNEKTLFN